MRNEVKFAVLDNFDRTVAVTKTWRKATIHIRNMWFVGRMHPYRIMQGTSALDWVEIAYCDPIRPFPKKPKVKS